MWWLTCPNSRCQFQGSLKEFEPSSADECTCPRCGEFFEWEEPDDETEDLEIDY
jgi:hypothetical protein